MRGSKEIKQSAKVLNNKLSKNILKLLPSKFLLIIFLFLLFRFPGLGYDMSNTDALRWHYRSQDFLVAIKSGNFKDTYQHYQPGVTLMWLNAFVKQLDFTLQNKIFHIVNPLTLENSDYFPILNSYSIIAIITVLLFLFIYQYWIITKLYDSKIAFIYCFLLAVEPYIIGLDRWFHLTSLETYFAFSAILTILYWRTSKKNLFFIVSCLLLTLSVLSKLTTLIIVPIFIYTILSSRPKYLFYFAIVCLGFFTILFPAFAVAPIYVLTKLFSAVFSAVSDNYRNDLLSPTNRVLFYDLILLLKLSPITFLLFIVSIFNLKNILTSYNNKAIFVMLILYYLFLSFSEQKIDRYALVMFPSILLIGSIYLSYINKKYQKLILASSLVFIFVCSYIYYPVYSAYYSPLVLGTRGALSLKLYDNSGEYFSQAARYLNTKGREVKAFVPDGYASFAPFYKGKFSDSLSDTDYIVSSLDLTRLAPTFYDCGPIDKAFGSKEYSVVFVYRCK